MGSEAFVVKPLEGGGYGSNLSRRKSPLGPEIQGGELYVDPEGLEVLVVGRGRWNFWSHMLGVGMTKGGRSSL